MRFALIGPVYPYRGGIAHYTTLLSHHLAEHHEICLISFRRQYPSWLYPGRSDVDPSQTPLTVGSAQYILDPLKPTSWLYTSQVIRQFRPDALLFQWWVTAWAPSFSAILHSYRRSSPTSPIIAVCHNILPHESHWWDYLLAKLVLSLPTSHLVHSHQDKNRLLNLVPHANVSVVEFPPYHGLVSKRYSRADARNLLGLDQNVPVLLFFGFVRPYKGLKYLIQAVSQLGSHQPVHLLVVGEFWDNKQEYLDLIRRLGLTSFVTIVDEYVPNEEIGKYFDAANVLVLPYVKTSQSAVLQIAFEVETPVIASDTGGLSESIVDGVNGLVVKPEDVDSLVAAIKRYFQEGLEDKLRKSLASKHNGKWENIVSKIEALTRTDHPERRA